MHMQCHNYHHHLLLLAPHIRMVHRALAHQWTNNHHCGLVAHSRMVHTLVHNLCDPLAHNHFSSNFSKDSQTSSNLPLALHLYASSMLFHTFARNHRRLSSNLVSACLASSIPSNPSNPFLDKMVSSIASMNDNRHRNVYHHHHRALNTLC